METKGVHTTTIAALATAPASAGIAVIRVSGPEAARALRSLFQSSQSPISKPRRLLFGHLIDFDTGAIIDHALAVFMPNPYSFTGEDVAEFQFHGSPLIVQRMLKSLFAFGIVPAEPGEFSRRAFLNGKMDLVQSEAICDLITASSDRALTLATEQLEGRLSGIIEEVAEPLRNALAELEASIDFPEEDITPESLTNISRQIIDCTKSLEALIDSYSYGSVVKEGFRVLLCGAPNAGKSSLLNVFLGKERAIVTEIAGTTRDVLEESATISGYEFIFCDSAGIADTEDRVEKIGIELARERLDWADLVLLVVDAADEMVQWARVLEEVQGKARKIWMLVNKIDVKPDAIGKVYCDSSVCAQNFYLSAKTGEGLKALTNALVEEVSTRTHDVSATSGVVTNERHLNCLNRAVHSLVAAKEAVTDALPPEIISGEIRVALSGLEELVGKTHTEDLLGRIFSKFCIGK